MWIDSHCHLDAPEFDADRSEVVARAQRVSVSALVLPAVWPAGFSAVQEHSRLMCGGYALGTHPMWMERAGEDAAESLARALATASADPRCLAVGEIGLDFFVHGLDRQRQQILFEEQLRLARAHGLPVLLHVRKSVDTVLAGLRRIRVCGGIAHAFNGSLQQAHAFLDLGFKLGFGGAMTFEQARHLRRLAQQLPENAIVLETDAPDIPPQWIYRRAAERAAGASCRNEPAQLPRIGTTLAELKGWTVAQTAAISSANTCAALPRLAALLAGELAQNSQAG